MFLLRFPGGYCRARTLRLRKMGCGKGSPRSGSGRRGYSWHDGPSHAPVWAVLDAHRVIRHSCDENERARWASRAKQRGGPVEIASGPSPAVLRLGRIRLFASFGGFFLVLSWLVRLVDSPSAHVAADERMTEESYATLSRNQPPVKFKAEKQFRGWCIGSREGVFWF